MSSKEIKVLPSACAEFSLDLLAKIKELKYRIIDEIYKPGDKNNWLCSVCNIAHCTARKWPFTDNKPSK